MSRHTAIPTSAETPIRDATGPAQGFTTPDDPAGLKEKQPEASKAMAGTTVPVLPALWLALIDSSLPPEAPTWLDGSEHRRLSGLPTAAERRRRLVAWSLRRWALTQLRPSTAMSAWRFDRGGFGKPELSAAFASLNLHHSISHGGDYAAVLIAERPCGVDVEGPTAGLEAIEVAFSVEERAAVLASPDPHATFLRLWVAKEALLKLDGSGFATAPETVSLALADDGRSARAVRTGGLAALRGREIRIVLWRLEKGHWLAAAVQGAADAPIPIVMPWQSA